MSWLSIVAVLFWVLSTVLALNSYRRSKKAIASAEEAQWAYETALAAISKDRR